MVPVQFLVHLAPSDQQFGRVDHNAHVALVAALAVVDWLLFTPHIDGTKLSQTPEWVPRRIKQMIGSSCMLDSHVARLRVLLRRRLLNSSVNKAVVDGLNAVAHVGVEGTNREFLFCFKLRRGVGTHSSFPLILYGVVFLDTVRLVERIELHFFDCVGVMLAGGSVFR